jgi:type I restriction enzyme S subunit
MNNWQIKKLNEICDKASSNVSQNKLIDESGKYPVYGAGGFIKNISFYHQNKKYISIVKDGAGIGRITLLPAKSSVIGTLQYLIPKENIDIKFLYYILSSFDFSRYRNGATIPHIYFKEYSEESFLIPDKKEQKRVVKILDEVFENVAKAKENAEKNLKNSKELFESYLQDIFRVENKDWEIKKLSEVCEKITDGTHQTPKYFNDGIIFLSSRNVTSGKINWEKIKYIDKKQHLEMHKRVAPKMDDILLAKNGTTGVAAMVDRDVIFDIYVSLALLRSKGAVFPSFLLYFINSPVAKKQFNKRLKGSGVPNLHLEEIREVLISFPKSIVEQKAIVRKLDALSAETKKLEGIYQQKLADLEELKKSVLKSAFAGEL